jgi:hypothetical protein
MKMNKRKKMIIAMSSLTMMMTMITMMMMEKATYSKRLLQVKTIIDQFAFLVDASLYL